MSKYIIKNCPYYSEDETLDGYENMTDCQNITDCLLKQIVELAKGYKEELIDRKTKKVVATRYFKLTKEILELLDIQEVE
jgi:hypothetical protein